MQPCDNIPLLLWTNTSVGMVGGKICKNVKFGNKNGVCVCARAYEFDIL